MVYGLYPVARENVSVESNWSRKRREFCAPITERSRVKAQQPRNTFDTHLKLALYADNDVKTHLNYIFIINCIY